jgi:hypothetical protein
MTRWGRRVSEDGRERQPLYDAQLDRVLLGVADWYFYALLAFGLLGVPWAWSRERSSSVVLPMTVLWLSALHGIVFFGDPRFHYPLLPVLALLASLPLCFVAERVRASASSRVGPGRSR